MVSKIKTLFDNQSFLKYFKNTSWLFLEKILRLVVGLFIGVWIARFLGPDKFGIYSYTQSFVALFAPLAALGLDGIIVRELVKNKLKNNKLLGTAFILRLIGAFFVIALIVIAINLTNNSETTKTYILIISISIIFQSFNIIDSYFQSKVLSKYIVYANSIMLFISSSIKIFLITNGGELSTFIWVILFDNIVLASGFIYFYTLKNGNLLNWSFDKKLAKKLLYESWPLILSSAVISIYMRIDQVMIKEMLDAKATGQYAAAVKLSEALYFFPAVVVNSIFPAIIKAKSQGIEIYYQRLQSLYNLMVWSAIAVALPITFLGNWLISMLFGEAYYESSQVLKIHIWTLIFISLLLSSGKWIINEGYMTSALYRNLAGVSINIILNYLFITKYGIVGAAYATLISYSVAGFFYDYFDKNLKKNFYLKRKSLIFY